MSKTKCQNKKPKKKKEVHIQFKHLLKSIIQKPEVFKKPEMQYLREFVTTVESNREKYPKVMGDKQYNEYIQSISDSSDKDISLTAGYIEAISRGQDASLMISENQFCRWWLGTHSSNVLELIKGKLMSTVTPKSPNCSFAMETGIQCWAALLLIFPLKQEN